MITIKYNNDTWLLPTNNNWGVAYDECHKLYLVRDKDEWDEAKSYGYNIYELKELATLYQDSCPLKFISFWDISLNPLVPQCTDIDIDCYRDDCFIEIHDVVEKLWYLDDLADSGILTRSNSPEKGGTDPDEVI